MESEVRTALWKEYVRLREHHKQLDQTKDRKRFKKVSKALNKLADAIFYLQDY